MKQGVRATLAAPASRRRCAALNRALKKKRNETLSKAVSPVDGPVAVTGASGYIGSWCVYDLMESGYNVRACVRDKNKPREV